MKTKPIVLVILYLFILQTGFGQKERDASNDSLFILKNESPSFLVKFPAAYSLKESSIDNGLKSERYESVFNDDIYMLKYSAHKNAAVTGDNQVFMDASLESFVNGIKGTLIDKSTFKYYKTNGIEAFISIDEKNLYVFYRVLIIDRVQYQIIAITKSKEKTKAIDRFFKSLIITIQ
jgi:hypothetical protein